MRDSRLFVKSPAVSCSIFVAIVLAGGVVSCSGAADPAQGKTPVKYVTIRNQAGKNPYGFRPQTVAVALGTRVVWRNLSSQPHTVTAKGGHPLFSSGVTKLIEPKHQWSFVFHRTGRYTYYCVVHPYMEGTVVVRSGS